jgi:hypothetical protein
MRGRDEEQKRREKEWNGFDLIEYVESVKVEDGNPKLKEKRRLDFNSCSGPLSSSPAHLSQTLTGSSHLGTPKQWKQHFSFHAQLKKHICSKILPLWEYQFEGLGMWIKCVPLKLSKTIILLVLHSKDSVQVWLWRQKGSQRTLETEQKVSTFEENYRLLQFSIETHHGPSDR